MFHKVKVNYCRIVINYKLK